jgi:hypothetical protein
VAIKVMAPELATTSPARKRFLREARASAQIRHEHVVSVYDVGEKPIPYLVMEFVPGQTLQQRLDQRGPLDVPDVLRLGIQIAEGLAAAHAQDLIHRDIKPGNILLETSVQDHVKITDFGLARAADDASMTKSGMIAGTPMYMAPEQALGLKLDQRADLFSLGSVLYQMVSGRAPFRAPSTLAVLKRLTEDTPRPIQEIIPETPDWLCNIIARLHAKNPDERFQTAREVADLLEQHLAHWQQPSKALLPAAVNVPPRKQVRPSPQKLVVDHPVLGGVAILMLLVAVATATYMLTESWFGSNYAQVSLGTTDPDVQVYLTSDMGWVYRLQAGKETPLPKGTYSLDAYGGPGNDIDLVSVDVSAPSGTKGPPAKQEYLKGRNEGKGIHLTLAECDRATINVRIAPTEASLASPGTPGWTQLFNGKDLTGWKFHPDHSGQWEVKDGILRGSMRQSHLFTERGDYRNFHLRAEVKVNLGGDSGILFRAPLELRQGRTPTEFGIAGCYEAELQQNRLHPRPTGSISEASGDAPPNSLGRVSDNSLTQPDQWFTLEVIAENNHFITKINGKEAANSSDPLDRHQTGHLALQVWHPNTLVQFRKIEIMELKTLSTAPDRRAAE